MVWTFASIFTPLYCLPMKSSHHRSPFRRAFTLLELILVCAILGFFLYLCSQTLISTLMMEKVISEEYDQQREQTFGWSILHRDLQHTVGIYYHHQSFWQAPETKGDGNAPPVPAPTPAPDANTKPGADKPARKGLKGTSAELLIFKAEAQDDEPFLEIVVSRGRIRDPVDKDDDKKVSPASFRKVKYYLTTTTGDDMPEGSIIMRTEERWQDAGDKKDQKIDDKEKTFDLKDFRRYTVLMGIKDVELTVYNGTAWVEEWSSQKQGDLPLALRVKYRKSSPSSSEAAGSAPDELSSIFSFPLSYRIVGEPEEDF